VALYGDDIIEQVREASDILEVISSYLPLKRKGRNWWGKCPFHTEKTPSFSVSPDKQIYHCFGCHKGGSVFSFIIEYEKIPFPDALKLLAERAHITLPDRSYKRDSRETEQLHYAHEVAAEFFFENLKDSRKTLEYLKTRKLNDETIQTFKLGYALDSWDALLNYAKQKSLSEDDLEKAGLAIKREAGGIYDRFRDRLTFTISNNAQKPIAFGARTFKATDEAKYINSPETPLYHKASVLYGLSHSRGEIRKTEEAIVVEGYFDFLSLYQAGVHNVVASSGTAFTPEQALLLARSAPGVILMFDADSAGQQAALRSVDFLFEAGLEVRVVALPQGEDPDSIVRSGGREAIEEQLARAQSYVEFSLSTLPDRWSNLSLGVKDKTIKRLSALAAKIGDPVRRELFLQEISRWCGINLELLKRGVSLESAPRPFRTKEKVATRIESELIAALLARPDLIPGVSEKIAPSDFEDQTLADVYSLMVLLTEEEMVVTPAGLIDRVEGTTKKETIASLAAHDFGTMDLSLLLTDVVRGFNRRLLDRRLAEYKRLLAEAETEKDQEKIDYYLNEIRQLKAEV
jgi:DNA primase